MTPGLDTRNAASDFQSGTVELWTLYSIGVAVTILRTYAQGRVGGLKDLRLDDYLIWLAIIFYTAQTALAYSVSSMVDGLANSNMTIAQRATLLHSDPEYHARVTGSKIQIAGWTTYTALINSLKLSMLAFYVRLMEGLGRGYHIPIHIGFALVVASFLASLITIFAACRPFHKNWQIYPDPGNVCQPAISKPVIAVTFAGNLITDPYLILIPIPMLWKSSLKPAKKVAATLVLGAGIFVLVCATLKSALLLAKPENGAQLSHEWGTRETFVAVITTNLPTVFHFLRICLTKIFGSQFESSQKTHNLPSSGFRGIGGGDYYASRRARGTASTDPMTIGIPFTESEERMVEDVQMQNLKTYLEPVSGNSSSSGIVVSNQIEIIPDSQLSQDCKQAMQAVPGTW